MGDRINWHRDFVSGVEYPLEGAERVIGMIGKIDRADIRNVWELNRLHHLALMGQAYTLTGDEDISAEFMRQTSDWIDGNPVGFGPNWCNAMEASIRAANLTMASSHFVSSSTIDVGFWARVLESLYEHGKFIIQNLEVRLVPNNHLMADLAGLVYVGLVFRELPFGDAWLGRAVSGLVEEAKRQVRPEGIQYEGSIPYHRLATELLLYPAMILRRFRRGVDPSLEGRIRRMLDFIAYYTKPNGVAPVIGDNDTGRFFILTTSHPEDHRYLLSLGATYFRDAELRSLSGGPHGALLWALGTEGLQTFMSLEETDRSDLGSRAFRESGFFVMRHGDDFLIIRMPPFHRLWPRVHMHLDMLSFELTMNGVNFLVDPGVSSYTSDARERALFRGSRYHNGIVVDDTELIPWVQADFFSRLPRYKSKLLAWRKEDADCTFRGLLLQGSKGGKRIPHIRTINYDNGTRTFRIHDSFEAKGQHSYDYYLHVSVGGSVEVPGEDRLLIQLGGESLELSFKGPKGLRISVLEGHVAPSYQDKRGAPIVKISWQETGPARIEMEARCPT
jgi:hypothetical protein